MKLKHIISAGIAALALVVGCEPQVYEPSYLNEIKVSSSYVALPVDGGETTITLTATAEWTITDTLSWVTVSPTSGAAGEFEVTFTAEATESTLTGSVYVNCAGVQQTIKVLQMAEAIELPITPVSEVLAAEDGTFRVKGTCTAISNTTYGNWYLDDGTGSIYIYGTLDANGQEKNFTSLGIEVGDIVTVEGPLTIYNGTYELVDVTVIDIEKSLITVEEAPTEALPIEGGEALYKLIVKGDGVSVNIPEDAKSWLSISGIEISDTTYVTFLAAENTGGDRSADLTFVTTSDGVEYTAAGTLEQKGAIIETTADQVNAGVDGTSYRLTGLVSEIANSTYGNYYVIDYTDSVYVYGTLDADGNTRNFSSLGINAGDIVTVMGPKSTYNGNAQLVNVVVEDHKVVTGATVAEFLAAEEGDSYYRLTGTVTNLANTTYGNFDLVDETGSVYVYGVVSGWGGPSKQFESLGIEEGDTITIVGLRSSYGGNPQVGSAFYVSHEEGGSEDPDDPGTDASEYETTLAYVLGENAYDDGAATVNGVADVKTVKLGTAKKDGTVTFTVPAGSTSVSYYGVGWKGSSASVTFTSGESTLVEQAVAANDGATGNAPYTITVADSDKYTITFDAALEADTEIVATSSGRVILFGVQAQ